MLPGSSPPIQTADGTNPGPFGAIEWGLTTFNSLVWGSSYLLIAISLDAFTPGMVAWLRIILGAAVLALVPSSRRKVERADWRGIVIISIAGNAGPAYLFAVAEQTVEDSVAGLLSAAVPLATAAIAFGMGQRSLRRVHVIGLVAGLAGVVLLSLPSLTGAQPAVGGVLLVLLAVVGYALTGNVMVPLAKKYGGIPVVMRAQAVGIVLLAPVGLHKMSTNRLELGAVLALLSLGILSTGVGRVVQAIQGVRVGAPRASIVGYLLPIVALILGAVFRQDVVSPLEVIGLGIVLVSAFLVSRSVASTQPAPTSPPATP